MASNAVRAAELEGADRYPGAAGPLRIARAELKEAEGADGKEANRKLDRAYEDAELARALARRDRARADVEASNRRLRELSAR